jgi:CSLREA domain-containing protein
MRAIGARLRHSLAAVTLAVMAVGGSAGGASAQVPPPLLPPPPLVFPGSTFTVTMSGDTDDGVCDGRCTLREAINAANANAGFVLRDADHIAFRIPLFDSLVIQLQSTLPALTDNVVVDGDNQPTPGLIVINGQVFSHLTPNPGNVEVHGGPGIPTGITVSASATLRNLVVSGFSVNGLSLSSTTFKTLEQLNVHGNGTGVALSGSNATLTNSTITQNSVGVQLGGSLNTVSGNTITANTGPGVRITGFNDTLGGNTPSARNVISGNTGNGVELSSGAASAHVLGNYIGVDAAGTAALPNSLTGITDVSVSSNTIGGLSGAERNVISGNSGDGVQLNLNVTPGSAAILVQGNFIGTNATGTAAIPNGGNGVSVNGFDDAAHDDITPHLQLTGNVISGNRQHGVFLRGGAHHVLQSNLIGTDAGGTGSLGNGTDGQFDGVFIQAARRVTVGGDSVALGNVIAHNANTGVMVFTADANSSTTVGNTIRLNSIFANGRLGIDLVQTSAENGFGLVTPNDLGDADNGGNRRQNFPILQTAVVPAPGSLIVVGTLNSTAASATLPALFAVDFYASATCDFGGSGEGERYLGSFVVATNSAGHAPVVLSVAPNPAVTSGVITATATSLVTGDTSEFSPCVSVN